MDRRGNVSLYSALGEHISEFHFGNVSRLLPTNISNDDKLSKSTTPSICVQGIGEVRDVRIFPSARDSGVAVVDDQMRIFVVNSVNEPIVWSMHNRKSCHLCDWSMLDIFQSLENIARMGCFSGIPAIKEPPSAWTVLQPRSQLTQICDISLAIDQCISTAFSTWSPKMQKALLKASHFGMAFSTGFDSTRFVRTLRELRVLNEVHRERIGMPITSVQLQELGESCLINRLIDIGAYGLAAEICSWLGREQQEGIDRVLLEWVRRTISKVASSANIRELNMEALDEKIAQKLLCYPHVSLADAAKRAIEAKLPKLARLLIKREKDDAKQVYVLLQLGDVQEALTKAAAAQRPQLMHQVIRHLMKGQKRAEYELAIRKIPLAQCLYQDLVRQESERGSGKMMLALLEQASDFERQIMFHLDAVENEIIVIEMEYEVKYVQTVVLSSCGFEKGYQDRGNTFQPNDRLNSLRRAKEAARNMGDKGVEELLTDLAAFAPGQLERGQEHMTIRQTVIEHAADAQKVAQLKHQAKLSDKQVHLWTIEGLAKMGRMEQLFDMAQKKSPVGYVPFIKACIKHNRREECKKYIAKVNGYQDLVAAYIALGLVLIKVNPNTFFFLSLFCLFFKFSLRV
uniref:Vacuolar protein sorting-associated protein 16 homolog n=1 Tax=Angiostrongylus cantonensis TaxID=6313 RepID=A0A158PAM1_ANGCA